ncbi:MAG: radical SAM protein [Nitrospirae bacterium]|nr:radical SAM protein [Nitrospirota bacterium]
MLTDSGNISIAADKLWEMFKITPDDLSKLKVIEGSVYLTRKCNLSCQYCKIIKTQFDLELGLEEWKEALMIMESLGIRFVNIAGGEPTVLPWIGELIRFINEETSMEYSIVSNSTFKDSRLDELVNAGLKTYVASIDVLGGEDNGLGHLKKSSSGIKMLHRLKEKGVPNLCGNIVITACNIDNVMDVVEYLNDNGFWTNICPIIWGKGDKWEKTEIMDNSYRLTEAHEEKMSLISERLIQMKKAGALILPTEEYLRNMPSLGVRLNWKCFNGGIPPRLIVDADGAVMDCINVRGKTSKQFNIFDFSNKAAYKEYMKAWKDNVAECSGCYWSTMYTAKERQKMLGQMKAKLY